MAKLTAAKRKKMPQKEFAGPGTSFPVNDKKHARLAISGATRSANSGNISKSEEAKIKAKARSKMCMGGSYSSGGRCPGGMHGSTHMACGGEVCD